MNHVTHRIQAYLDGELAPAEAQRMLEHLEACEDCRRDLLAHRHLNERLASAAAAPVLAPIWPHLSGRLARRGRQAWSWPHRGLAVAATVAGILVGWRLGAPGTAETAATVVTAGEVGYLEAGLPSLDHLWLQLEDVNGDDGS